mmetsp:Transcript_27878/g.82011  ORF Transcript_27878/g.82011 Transcript_27878/m.82011 type:complete len:209 (-) Transcript_27878:370-996(-)
MPSCGRRWSWGSSRRGRRRDGRPRRPSTSSPDRCQPPRRRRHRRQPPAQAPSSAAAAAAAGLPRRRSSWGRLLAPLGLFLFLSRRLPSKPRSRLTPCQPLQRLIQALSGPLAPPLPRLFPLANAPHGVFRLSDVQVWPAPRPLVFHQNVSELLRRVPMPLVALLLGETLRVPIHAHYRAAAVLLVQVLQNSRQRPPRRGCARQLGQQL